MAIFDEPKFDGHVHIFDPARFPYRDDAPYRPAGQEIGTAAQLLAMMDAYGVRQAMIVQPNSGYLTDNACTLDMLARHPGRFRGTAVVEHGIGPEDLRTLRDAGIVGVAINTPMFGIGRYRDIGPLCDKLAALDLFLEIQVQADELVDLLPLIAPSGVRLLIDHCGRPVPEAGLDQPGFRALLDLGRDRGRAGRAAVKLGGEAVFSRLPFPHPDALTYQHALLDAFGPSACLWGSNWPFIRAAERIDYGPLLTRLAALLPDPAARRAVLWDNPRRLFGFAP